MHTSRCARASILDPFSSTSSEPPKIFPIFQQNWPRHPSKHLLRTSSFQKGRYQHMHRAQNKARPVIWLCGAKSCRMTNPLQPHLLPPSQAGTPSPPHIPTHKDTTYTPSTDTQQGWTRPAYPGLQRPLFMHTHTPHTHTSLKDVYSNFIQKSKNLKVTLKLNSGRMD